MVYFPDNGEGWAALRPAALGGARATLVVRRSNLPCVPGAALPQATSSSPAVATQRCHGNKTQTSHIEHSEVPWRRRHWSARCQQTGAAGNLRARSEKGIIRAHPSLRAALRSALESTRPPLSLKKRDGRRFVIMQDQGGVIGPCVGARSLAAAAPAARAKLTHPGKAILAGEWLFILPLTEECGKPGSGATQSGCGDQGWDWNKTKFKMLTRKATRDPHMHSCSLGERSILLPYLNVSRNSYCNIYHPF